MTHLLFVIDNLEFGGGERGFLQLASRLMNNFEICFAATPGGKLEQGLDKLEIKVYPLDVKKQFSMKPIFQINEIIRIAKIDMIHSQGARADFFARVAGRISGVPHILSTIQMPVEGFDVGHLRRKMYRFMDRLSEKYVERFIVVSDSLKRTLIEERGIPAQRVIKIYNGIELDQYHPDAEYGNLRKQWGIPEHVPLIGAIGRMVWQKGFEYLIEAIPAIIKTFPKARILIVGDGPLRERLEALGGRLKVKDNVIFTGFRSDIKEILAAIDILAIPSLLEGFPMITLEAMAMATPIITTRIDGIVEQILDGEEGILVPPRDPDALAKAIIRVCTDTKSGKTMGLAGRKKAEQEFSVEKMVLETVKVYMSFLKRNHGVL